MIPSDLNQAQHEAARHEKGPLLIVAGAGSGKTKTLTALLMNLLKQRVSPENIVAITFTNKAAEEMRRRALTNGPFIGTFHSLGVRILKKEARLVKRTENFSIFDEDDALRTVKEVLKKMDLSSERYRPAMVANKISKHKDEFTAPDTETMRKIFEHYEETLQRYNAFDFDDLIEKPVRIFENNPKILQKYQDRFKYILIDEYQDINTSQYWLVKLLAGKHRNIFVVGDDAQSIYGFRGSDFRNFINFEKDWPGAKIVFMEQNYRSTRNIITAANALIKNNQFQKPKNLWTANPEGQPVIVAETRDENEEAEWIVSEIESGIMSRELREQKGSIPSIAILYRTNAQSRALEQALLEHDIPYEIFGGLRFHARKEVKDVIAGLRYAFNPKDRLSEERIQKTFSKSRSPSLLKTLPRAAKTLSVSELLGFFIESTDYFSYLERNFKNSMERTENIRELIKLAAEADAIGLRPPAGLQLFLEKMSLLQENDKTGHGNEGAAVRLSTIHLAKGLEFDAVLMAGCNEGILPHQMSLGSDEEIEEERRLMYVAMTRAKKSLRISFYDLPSRFLHELPPELIEFRGAKPLDDEERYISLD